MFWQTGGDHGNWAHWGIGNSEHIVNWKLRAQRGLLPYCPRETERVVGWTAQYQQCSAAHFLQDIVFPRLDMQGEGYRSAWRRLAQRQALLWSQLGATSGSETQNRLDCITSWQNGQEFNMANHKKNTRVREDWKRNREARADREIEKLWRYNGADEYDVHC